MKTYLIAGIYINISYVYDDYLKDNIEKYEIQKQKATNYQIQSSKSDFIKEPKGQLIRNRNPFIVKNKKLSYFFVKNRENQIRAMFVHDENFFTTKIFLNEYLLENPDEIEYIFMSMIFTEIASRHNMFILHASAIIDEGKVILISAPSKTGKSTLANNYIKLFKTAQILNDDKPLVKYVDKVPFVYGSPFSGKNSLNKNISAPLKLIVFLHQGMKNHISRLEEKEVMLEFLKNIHRPMEEQLMDQTIEMLNCVINEIQIIKFDAKNHIDAAIVLNKYIYQKDTHQD